MVRSSLLLVAGSTLLIAAGCILSPDDPLSQESLLVVGQADCAEVDLTYDKFGRQFLSDYCARCHSVQLTTDISRSDAPLGIDFDTLEGATDFSSRIRLRAGELGDMPPALLGGPRPTDEERVMLMQWVDCGME